MRNPAGKIPEENTTWTLDDSGAWLFILCAMVAGREYVSSKYMS